MNKVPKFARSAGVLMPLFSMPSVYGIGCFSRDVDVFVDMAVDMGFHWWQVLPLTVIGAGNSAMDVARTALRKGVRWLQCFSRTSTVAASQHEYNYALLEGVEFVYCKIPVEITDEGVIFADAEEKEDGTILQIPGTEKLYPADSVIISISQGPKNQLVNTTKGLEANQKGLLVADEEGHTSRPEIFASGDVVNGARTVVEAVAHSKEVAEAMDQYMQSLKK